MFRRNEGKIFSRVLQLHRVTFLSGEIDHDLIQKKAPFCDAPESPTFMQTKRPRFELVEFFGRFGSKLAGFD